MSEELRKLAVEIYSRGLEKITPDFLLRQALTFQSGLLKLRFLEGDAEVALEPGGRILLLAVGKAAAPMAAEAARLLGDAVTEGLVVTKEGFALPGLPYPQLETGHPVPDERGAAAAAAAEALLGRAGEDDVVLVLVSGGASALLPAPLEGISLAEKQKLAEVMLRTEMDIHEINRVRKALSRFKGGGMVALAAPARTVGLYLSDVPGDVLSSIGSGPTVPAAVDAPAVILLLREKGIWEEAPAGVRTALEAGGNTALRADGRPTATSARPPINGLIGTNRHLLRAMAEAARGAGFLTRVEESPTTGLNPAALSHLLARWERFAAGHPAEPLALISGGETLVEVTGSGMGGRCQELAALMMARLTGDGTVFLAAGSDGNDGPTDAAGGVVDAESHRRAQEQGIPTDDLLADNDSYHLLERSGNLIKVPPTRNNVMDVHLFLRSG